MKALRIARAERESLNTRRPRAGTISRQIVDRWAKGFSSGEIAHDLKRKVKYVENQIWSLRKRYGVSVVGLHGPRVSPVCGACGQTTIRRRKAR